MHRLPFVLHAIAGLAQHQQGRTGAGRHVRAEARQCVCFFEDPRELPPYCFGNAVQRDRPPQVEARSDIRDSLFGAGAQLFEEDRLDVPWPNAAGRQLVAVSGLRQVRLAPQVHRRMFDRLFERQVLEGVQRVVVDENADGSLGR